ncbi:uncharacterized protein PADG_01238 [Paracoccidioides brasiliensis Pb18]|uniref:Homeobox domain-containing protein n=1 Tax=Paracoccidioides brasiliensis (strain Pb18) TaxID=502780 RepID=C1G2S2_PARBD|nr:uncharacterized protein PADG_01238 [Paracoccidioides brasiliensis Pb18]EEH45088.2 hypothetical protein PADG_01238 [Paracoccidioides brasiliensis Pb18]
MFPVSIYTPFAGWCNQQLESRESVTRRFEQFSTVIKGCDCLGADIVGQGRICLKLKVPLDSSPIFEIKEDPAIDSKGDNEIETHNEMRGAEPEVCLTETEDMDANSEIYSAMPSVSKRLNSGIPLASNSGSAKFEAYDDIDEVGADWDNEIDVELDRNQLGPHGNHEERQLQAEEDNHLKTTAELLAEKRKMKRFRLTHNQTRFLINEFTRQAHPDAAHRERLSKVIPGLSPRQVQVWFQNRRAKLKRLTSDDRERILKSRTLPDDFNIVQALHFSFVNKDQPSSSTTSPSQTFKFCQGADTYSPLIIDATRRTREEEYVAAPLNTTSVYGGYFPPSTLSPALLGPEPELFPSTTETNINPICTSISNPRTPASRCMNMLIRSNNFSNSYSRISHTHVPYLPFHETEARANAGLLGSPLRATISYAEATLDYGAPDASYTELDIHFGDQSYDSFMWQRSEESSSSKSLTGSQLGKREFSKALSARLRTAPAWFPAKIQLKTEIDKGNGP